MAVTLISLGSNKRNANASPAKIVMLAANSVASLGKNAKLSSLYRSDAWPDPIAPAYVNAVIRLETDFAAEEILSAILAMEAGFSRIRSTDPAKRYAPRTLDLDLLAHGDVRMETAALSLPHPRMAGRGFVLLPLAEIAPDWCHPATGETASEMAAACDPSSVTRLPFTG